MKDLKGWLQEYNRKKDPVRRQWELLVRLIHLAFGDVTLPEELTRKKMVFLPK